MLLPYPVGNWEREILIKQEREWIFPNVWKNFTGGYMKTVITLVTVLVFFFIVYKRKFAPGKKAEKKKAPPAPIESGTKPEPVQYPAPGGSADISVLVFDYSEHDSASSFSTFIDSKVSFSLVWMKDRGYAVRDMKMAVMDKVLVVFIIYGTF